MRAVVRSPNSHTRRLRTLAAVLSLLVVSAVPLNSQSLRGQVVDSVDSTPLTGIEVVVLDTERDTVAVTRSGVDGRFEVNLAAGNYTLCFRCIGRRPKQVPVEVPSERVVVIGLAQLRIPARR